MCTGCSKTHHRKLLKYSQRIVSDLMRCVFLTVSSLCPSQYRHIAMVLYVSLCYPPLQGDQFITDTQTWQYEQWVISLPLWFNLSHWFHLWCHLENKMTMDYSTFLINSNNRSFTCRIGKRPLHMVQHMILYFLFFSQTFHSICLVSLNNLHFVYLIGNITRYFHIQSYDCVIDKPNITHIMFIRKESDWELTRND